MQISKMYLINIRGKMFSFKHKYEVWGHHKRDLSIDWILLQSVNFSVIYIWMLTFILQIAKLANTKLKNTWNPVKWELILEYSVRAIQWIATWQGLDGFQKSLRSYAFNESSLSMGRVSTRYNLDEILWFIFGRKLFLNVSFPTNIPGLLFLSWPGHWQKPLINSRSNDLQLTSIPDKGLVLFIIGVFSPLIGSGVIAPP